MSPKVQTHVIKGLAIKFQHLFHSLGSPEAPSGGRRPHNASVIGSLIGFSSFGIFVAIAAWHESELLRLGVGIIGAVLLGVCSITAVIDISHRTSNPYRALSKYSTINLDRVYSRNLGNTILTAIITTGVISGLYVWELYPALHRIVIELSDDTVSEISYPGVALFQRYNFSAQANLHVEPTKCYMGWYDEKAPNCTVINSSLITNSGSCNFQDIWSTKIMEDFVYQDRKYRYLEFPSAMKLNSTKPTTLLWLQAFFDYNKYQATQDNDCTPSPGLSIAVYDPHQSLEYRLNNSLTRMIDINASGVTSISIGLRYHQYLDRPAAYDYDLSLSSAPALDIVCDTSGGNNTYYYGACATSLFIRIPSFDRSFRKEQRAMSWIDVAGAAGAYYSFVQFVSRISSGAALAA